MDRWTDLPLPDGSYSDESRPWAQQDVVNYLPTFAEQTGTRSRLKYVCVPGLKPFALVGDGPHRGAHDVEGRLFVVSGTTLYQVTATGVAISRGTIPGTSRVSMAHNQIAGGNELIIATGSNSYVYNTVADTLTATGTPLLFVDFINQMIVGVDVGRRFWRYSGLADATSWNALDVESAESSPDRLVGVIVSQGEALLFGERTIEVWANSVTESTAFQRSAVIEKGCANGNTICRLDNTVYFCGNDGIPCRLQGYSPVPIASKAITTAVSAGDASKLFALTWEDRGYVVYYLTAQDGQTWGYDVTCQKWHRRQSYGLDRWRLNALVKSNGTWYGGDYSSGKLYKLEWGYALEGSATLPRRIRSGVLHSVGNRIRVHALRVLANTALPETVATEFPEQPDPPTITGAAPDGTKGAAYEGYTYTLTGTAPLTVAVRSGALPAGLEISSAGVIDTGTPTELGEETFTLRVTDANGLYAELTDTIKIRVAPTVALAVGGIQTPTQRFAVTNSPDGLEWEIAKDNHTISTGRFIAALGSRFVVWDNSNAYYTGDGGETWNGPYGSFGGFGSDHTSYTRTDTLIIPSGNPLGGGVFVTTDGENFTNYGTHKAYNAASNASAAVCLTNESTVVSTDGGENWTAGGTPGIYFGSNNCMSCNDTTFLIGGTSASSGGSPMLSRSTDNGTSWEDFTFSDSEAGRVAFLEPASATEWVAAMDTGELWYSEDDCETWTKADDELGVEPEGLCSNGPYVLVAGGSTGTAGVMMAAEPGSLGTWVEVDQPLDTIGLISALLPTWPT